MAELGSIGDLKIVVDAETAKFRGDLEAARGIVAQFVAEGSKSLSLFDGVMAKTGVASDLVKGKLDKLQGAMDTAAKRMVPVLGQLSAFAATLGVEKEWDALTKSVGEFAVVTGKVGNESFSALVDKIKQSGLETLQAKAGTLAFTAATGDAAKGIDGEARALGAASDAARGHAGAAQVAQSSTEALTRASEQADTRAAAFSRNLLGAGDAATLTAREVSGTASSLVATVPAADAAGESVAGAGGKLREFADKARDAAAGSIQVAKALQEQQGAARGVLASYLTEQTEKVKSATVAVRGLQKGIQSLTEDQITTRIAAVEKSIAEVGVQLRAGHEPGLIDRLLGNDMLAAANLSTNLRLHLEALRKELESRVAGGAWTADLVFADMDKFVEDLEKANQKLRDEAELAKLSKGAAAERKIMRDAEREADKQDLAIEAEKKARIKDLALENRRLVESEESRKATKKAADEEERRQENDHKAVSRVDESIARDFEALQSKARALTMNADAATAAGFAEKLFNEARRAGLDLTPADIAGINQTAEAYAALNRSVKELERSQQAMQATTAVFSNAISSEFSRWTQSGEFNVRRMVANMLAEMAKLILMRNVLGPIFGGNGTEGGGALGEVFKGIFGGGGGYGSGSGLSESGSGTPMLSYGGALASGGPMDADKAYLVGEMGPELVLPQRSGFVIPTNESRQMLNTFGQGAGGGGNRTFAPSVTLSIDARGATVDAVAQLEQLKGDLPGIILGTMSDANARGIS